MSVRIKRAYEQAEAGDGLRVLVDRLWPRGVSKEAIQVERWLKEVAPSDELRRWFGHDPDNWEAFKERYFAELEGRAGEVEWLLGKARQGQVTLVYSARDREHNQAAALKEYLEERLR